MRFAAVVAFALVALALVSSSAAAVVIGRSVEQRAIKAVRLGDREAERSALVVGSMHGDERGGLAVTRALRDVRVGGVDLWVVDSVNPDGLRRGVRQNARDVDLNRNFPRDWRSSRRGTRYYGGPRPFSEPESRVVRRLVRRVRPSVSIWYHQPWGAVLLCRNRGPMQRRYGRLSGLPVTCRGGGLPGTVVAWQEARFAGSTAFVVELPGGPVGPRTARRHARAAAAVVE